MVDRLLIVDCTVLPKKSSSISIPFNSNLDDWIVMGLNVNFRIDWAFHATPLPVVEKIRLILAFSSLCLLFDTISFPSSLSSLTTPIQNPPYSHPIYTSNTITKCQSRPPSTFRSVCGCSTVVVVGPLLCNE